MKTLIVLTVVISILLLSCKKDESIKPQLTQHQQDSIQAVQWGQAVSADMSSGF